jgi:hypothetical protein
MRTLPGTTSRPLTWRKYAVVGDERLSRSDRREIARVLLRLAYAIPHQVAIYHGGRKGTDQWCAKVAGDLSFLSVGIIPPFASEGWQTHTNVYALLPPSGFTHDLLIERLLAKVDAVLAFPRVEETREERNAQPTSSYRLIRAARELGTPIYTTVLSPLIGGVRTCRDQRS